DVGEHSVRFGTYQPDGAHNNYQDDSQHHCILGNVLALLVSPQLEQPSHKFPSDPKDHCGGTLRICKAKWGIYPLNGGMDPGYGSESVAFPGYFPFQKSSSALWSV